MLCFADRLAQTVSSRRNPVVVGLDPRIELIPEGLFPHSGLPPNEAPPEDQAAAVVSFCCGVIDVVAGLVPAVKVQAAFFERLGPAGMTALQGVIRHAGAAGLLVIFDGKRNDIGPTAAAYAQGILGRDRQSPWEADAVTVNPYLGADALEPFVEVAQKRDAGVFVLVKTSNPRGGMFQDLVADGRPVYEHVAALVEQLARKTAGQCGYGAVGAVVGATYPEQLARLRELMPHSWLLIPGYGAQGGTARDVAAAFDPLGAGAIVNNSRGIIFAYHDRQYAQRFGPGRWQEAVEAAAREMIEQLRQHTPAGRL
ncbi:MAG: orotidine-5'-phosphate decarboxylase [Thermoguttaceae bacterium]